MEQELVLPDELYAVPASVEDSGTVLIVEYSSLSIVTLITVEYEVGVDEVVTLLSWVRDIGLDTINLELVTCLIIDTQL